MDLRIHTYETGNLLSDTRWRAALEEWREEGDPDPFDVVASAGGDTEDEAVRRLRSTDPRAVGVAVEARHG